MVKGDELLKAESGVTQVVSKRRIRLPGMDYDGSTLLPDVRHELFVSNILQGMNDGDAYSDAGFKANNPATPACMLRTKPHIIARLAYRRAQLAEKLAITEERVLTEMAKLAFANMQDFGAIDEDGNFTFKDWQNLNREQLAAVESVTVTTTTSVSKKGNEYQTQHIKFALHDKQVSLEQLGKHLGLFAKDNKKKFLTEGLLLTRELSEAELSRLLRDNAVVDYEDAIAG